MRDYSFLHSLGRHWIDSLRVDAAFPWPEGPVVLGIWHEDLLWAARLLRPRPVRVLVSGSRDGDHLAQVLSGGRLEVSRGSSSRGGSVGARALLSHLRGGGQVANALDGPRGPARRAKRGAAWLADQAGCPLIVLGFHSRPVPRLGDWSRLKIPLPFARARAEVEP